MSAEKIIEAIGPNKLLDIRFTLSPSAATADEILAVAAEWVAHAEAEIAREGLDCADQQKTPGETK